MFRKIDKTSTFNDVLKQIIEKIQTGELKPGDALPAERILAEEFGISRPALREVLKAVIRVICHCFRRQYGVSNSIFFQKKKNGWSCFTGSCRESQI